MLSFLLTNISHHTPTTTYTHTNTNTHYIIIYTKHKNLAPNSRTRSSYYYDEGICSKNIKYTRISIYIYYIYILY